MNIDWRVIRGMIFALSITILASCMQIAGGYVQVVGVSDLDSAHKHVVELVEQSGFAIEECYKEPMGFKRACYSLYPPGYNDNDRKGRRYFSAEVWGDTKKKTIIIFFREYYVDTFTSDGKVIFDRFIKDMQTIFQERSVTFGTDRKTKAALWKDLQDRIK